MDDKTKRAYEILESIQSSYYKNQSEFDNWMKDFYKAVNKSLESYGITGFDDNGNINIFSDPILEPKTSFQNKYYYNLYYFMLMDIEKTSQELWSYPKKSMPVFGTLPTVELTAQISKQRDTEPIIIISQGLRTFSFCISKIVSLSFKIVDIENGMDVISTRKYIKENIAHHQLNKLYAKLLFEHYFLGRCNHIGVEFPSKHYQRLTLALSRAINYFALCHEYMHYLLGHYEKRNLTQKEKWDNELIADQHAILLTIKILSKENSITYILWGIYLFLKTLETFEIYDISLNGKLRLDNHPPFIYRKKIFITTLRKLNISEKFLDLKCIDYIVNKLRIEFSATISDIRKELPDDLIGIFPLPFPYKN